MRLPEYVARATVIPLLFMAMGVGAFFGRGSLEVRLGLSAFFFAWAALAIANYIRCWKAGRVGPSFFKSKSAR